MARTQTCVCAPTTILRIKYFSRLLRQMSSLTAAAPEIRPPVNVGMKELDRSKFNSMLPLVAAEISNPRMLSHLVKEGGRQDLLRLPRLPTIVNMDNKKRGVLLAQRITDPESAFDQLTSGTQALLKEAGFSMCSYNFPLNYDFWTSEEVLNSILPKELGDVPSGFSQVGHIAHMNLRDVFLPYKHMIGQIVLDKNRPSVRTVVHKLDSIDTVFRTFEMEVLAGEPEFYVEQLESNCRFRFDFRKVYWNSRLHTEHDRLVKQFGHGNAICDPMAGVGPFAILAAKNGNVVFANDLNPDSYESMKENVLLNKVNPTALQTFNEDGRIFIQKSIDRLHKLREEHKEVTVMMPKSSKGENPKKKAKNQTVEVPEYFSHYVMNLPASAIEFLDGFRGLYRGKSFEAKPPLPMVHVHCFFKFDPFQEEPGPEEVQRLIAERVSRALGYEMTPNRISLYNVRRVAPTKDMYEVSFELPEEVAYAE